MKQLTAGIACIVDDDDNDCYLNWNLKSCYLNWNFKAIGI